tara:strand:+ start:83 stop:259 length:177 start_codon:yes stop_codon:yes gene_type:complete
MKVNESNINKAMRAKGEVRTKAAATPTRMMTMAQLNHLPPLLKQNLLTMPVVVNRKQQ